ncbi:hypothetical protein BH24ACT5_BH24ACT5_13960 [soil metagenome]
MVGEADRALAEDSPYGLLLMASTLIEIDTNRSDEGPHRDEPEYDGAEVFESFAGSGWSSMDALALAIAALHPDERLTRRIRAGVDAHTVHNAAAWVATMSDITIVDVATQRDPRGDGDNILISWRWLDGAEATAVIYIDRNLGTIVKDAFVVPEGLAALRATMAMVAENDSAPMPEPIDPADARARIAGAIATGERMPGPPSDSWPMCRPLIEWLIGHLPGGGASCVHPEWPKAARQELLDEFVASSFGRVRGLNSAQVRRLAEPLIAFACDVGSGDPLRWTPVVVEIVLADWYPRTVIDVPLDDMERVPAVVAAFTEYAHVREPVGLRAMGETQLAVSSWAPGYLDAIRRPDRANVRWAGHVVPSREASGRAYEAMYDDRWEDEFDAADRDDEFDAVGSSVEESSDYLERMMVETVGGRERYDTLDDAPLRDIDFDWSLVPAEVHDATADTLQLIDSWAIEVFDPEVRAIARRVLAMVVTSDPGVFTRSSRTDALAAAILWYLRNRLSRHGTPHIPLTKYAWGAILQKDLAARTGVAASMISSRSQTVAATVGRAGGDLFGFLHSVQRRELLETRALIDEWRAEFA